MGSCSSNGEQMPLRMTVRRASQLFTASGTFTVPAGVFEVFVTVLAAGGGGGGNYGGSGQRGPGGGGGGGDTIFRRRASVTPGQQITCTVGLGGNPGTSGNSGSSGGASSFGSFFTVSGGSGGGPGTGPVSGGVGGQAGGPGGGHGGHSSSGANDVSEATGGESGGLGLMIYPSGRSTSPYGYGGAGAVGNMGVGLSGSKGGDGLIIVDWSL